MAKRSSKLTDMQLAFVRNYLVSLNAKDAAIRAGYSAQTAEQQGYQLLQHPLVSKEIEKKMQKRAQKLEITADRVLEELAKIGFSDIRNVVSFGPDGVSIKASDEIEDEHAGAISEVSETRSVSKGDGRDHILNSNLKIKMYDKIKALDLIGRHIGMWKSDNGDNGEVKITLNYEPKSKRAG